eukprot:scaffold11206_cov89-Skeletonema_dohrnii-CCMP3373.AAC.4
MKADLIVDFPHQRKIRAVHFAKTVQLHVFNRPDVARHELSYTKSEYDLMKLAVGEDVLALHAGRTSREPADDDVSSKECMRSRLAEQVASSGPHRAGNDKERFCNKIRQLGDYCTCLVPSDKEGHTESKKAW